MPKKVGIVFVTIGAVLILSALLLFLYNRLEEEQAGKNAGILLEDVRSFISERSEEGESTAATVLDEGVLLGEMDTPEEAAVAINGYDYIGYIAISSIEIELPVMAEWDYKRLKLAPCRQFGSAETDDLVIAAHNYETHFKHLSDLEAGAVVEFTDMEGEVTSYAVAASDTLAPDSVDAVRNSGYDLVLYTCTPGGSARLVVFCDRTD